MAVLGRLLISSAERLDLPDILSIDSYTAGDFKYLLKGLVGDSKPFILRGFDVIDPQNAIGTQSCAIRVADSVVFYPGSKAGPFFHGLQEGHPQAAPLVPELRKNAVNYVYLTFSTFNTSVDTRAFWDPDKDGGVGGEFTQDVNTESVLKVEVNVSTGSFPANTIPVAKITVGPVVITAIEDARDLLFRLGSGGLSPNPFAQFEWKSFPTPSYKRIEPPTKMLAGGVNPFQGADKNIHTLKEWMDAVMTKLRELGGTTYWYEDASTYSLISAFIDSNAIAFRSKGKWDHTAPGVITWTEDIHLKVTSDPRTYIIRAGTKTLLDEQVAYVPLIRNQMINPTDEPVEWVNGQPYVNTVGGALGRFSNLAKGDWIKKIDDGKHLFLRVEEFYDGVNASGPTTTPANARSILLSGNYAGTTEIKNARYDKGVYDVSDVLVSNRDNPALTSIGGNFNWLAIRADTIQNISNISPTDLTVDITNHDGSTAKVTSSVPHGLVDGDRVTISGSSNFDGTYEVEVEGPDVFYITMPSPPWPDELGVNCSYALVTTTTRSTPYGLQLESASHGFNSNDTIEITGTTSYNGNHVVNVRSPNSFTIPVSYGLSTENTGSATLKKIIVRRQGSVTQLIQGQSANIGGTDAENIRQYVGMQSMSAVTPEYTVPSSYNTLDGMGDFNSIPGENLTARVAKLTAMMADKAQDKTIKFCPADYYGINNTTSGPYQQIQFLSTTPPARLDIVGPGSDSNILVTVLLNGTLTLGPNQVAYFAVDRNVTSPITIPTINALGVTDITKMHVHENTFVFAVRLGTQDVWLWDGTQLLPNTTTIAPTHLQTIVKQNNMAKMVRGGMWSWNLLTNTLSWSLDAFIQVPSLNENRNRIAAGSVVLPNDGDVAYVDINRFSGPPATLTVSVANISSLPLNNNTFIIARRLGNSVDVGTGTILLQHSDSKALDSDDKISRVRLVDIVSTSLPSGPSAIIDGVSVSNGDTVLFTDPALNGIYMVSGVGVSMVWTKLNAFAGSDVPPEGAIVSVQDGSDSFNTAWSYFNGYWQQVDHSKVVKEPTGFPNRTDTQLSFNNATRTFTISPVGSSFDIYQRGRPYRFSSAQSVVIPNSEGLHYIYFNNGILTSTQTFSDSIITEYVFVATVQWDAANNVYIMLSDERHGITMDGVTHQYLHTAIGTRWISGLSAGNFTLTGTGNNNSDAQISISNGVVRDEDIKLEIIHSSSPSAPFEQVLSPVANIPVYYRSGPSGHWRKDSATVFPVKQGSSRIKFNDPSGPWTTPDATADDNFVAMWLFATNNQNEPVIAVLGQREDTSLTDAQQNNTYESLSFGDLPSLEMKVLYRLIFQTSSTYTNTPRARLVHVTDLRRAVDVALGTYAPGDHGLLTGLTDQDHPDYAIYVANPAAYVGGLRQINSSDNNDVQKALQSLDRFFAQLRLLPHPTMNTRVVVTGANQALTNNITLTQTIKRLMVEFDGAQIDFSTGNVYKSDGVTPLGLNFTPVIPPSGQYRWYAVSAFASTTNTNNTINLQILVLPASSDGSSPTSAPRAKYGKGIKLGQAYVRGNGSGIDPITTANLFALGTGGGSGSGGEGGTAFDVVAGENIPARTPVYISVGAADGGRNAGQAYIADPTNNLRKRFVGVTEDAVTAGQEVTVWTAGLLEDFTGLTPGASVFWDGTSYQFTEPTLSDVWVRIGVAHSSSALLIENDLGVRIPNSSDILTTDANQTVQYKRYENAQLTKIQYNEVTVNSTLTGSNTTLDPQSSIVVLTNGGLLSIEMIVAKSLSSPNSGGRVTIVNNTGNNLTLFNEQGSIAANRILTGTSQPLVAANNQSITLHYDTNASRWRVESNYLSQVSEFTAIAGENITNAFTPVYISKGNANGDTGRTAGQAYILDPDNDNRMGFVGIVRFAVNTGETAVIQTISKINIPVSMINGGSFTQGMPVYWDGVRYTQDNIIVNRKWACFVGTAISSNTLAIAGINEIENNVQENNAITDETLILNSLHDTDSFEYLSRIVVSNRSDLSLIDTTSTNALVNFANKTYQFISNNDTVRSIDLLDPVYLSEGKDLDEVRVISIFKPDALSNNFTYSVSRDNGANWENVTMTRFEQTSLYTGTKKFNIDNYVTTGSLTNDTFLVLNTTTQKRIGQRLVVGANPLISRTFQISIDKIGSPSGYLVVKLVKENGSEPSNNITDILAQQDFNIASISSGTLNVDFGKVVLRNNTNYYIVIEATNSYYSSFVSGTTEIRINTLAVSGTGLSFVNDGVSWSLNSSRNVVFTYENRVFRLLLRIEATAANAGQIKAVGLLYGKDKIEITPTIYSTFIVGTQQQVDLGLATHASLTAALNEIPNNVGGKIILLNSTIAGNVTWNKSGIVLEGYGRGSVIDGDLTINGHNNIIKGVVVNGDLTVSGDYNTINESWLDNGNLSDTGVSNDINLIWDI